MSELETFSRFVASMGRRGLRSITVSDELYKRLQLEADHLGMVIDHRLSRSMTIAGVEVVVDKADEMMRQDIYREQMDNYLAVKRNAEADGMIEIEPGHFVRPSAAG